MPPSNVSMAWKKRGILAIRRALAGLYSFPVVALPLSLCSDFSLPVLLPRCCAGRGMGADAWGTGGRLAVAAFRGHVRGGAVPAATRALRRGRDLHKPDAHGEGPVRGDGSRLLQRARSFLRQAGGPRGHPGTGVYRRYRRPDRVLACLRPRPGDNQVLRVTPADLLSLCGRPIREPGKTPRRGRDEAVRGGTRRDRIGARPTGVTAGDLGGTPCQGTRREKSRHRPAIHMIFINLIYDFLTVSPVTLPSAHFRHRISIIGRRTWEFDSRDRTQRM